MTEVVAAFISEGGKFMICKRPENKKRGGLWEFVGGKVEPGERPRDALRRECREELDVDIEVGGEIASVVYEYPDVAIRLTLFACVIVRGVPKLLEHSEMRYITAAETDLYAFCPADTGILDIIKNRFGDMV